MACTGWRGVEERIDWFLSHNPSGSGMCAQHTWHALGGDKGCPPAWSCSDANECVSKVFNSGRAWTPDTWDGPPPRGAWVGWKYGNNGHAAISNGDGTITTTDPSNGKPTGVEPLDYPKKWGFDTSDGPYTVWTDTYNKVQFEVAGVDHGAVYLSKLVYGQMDSDSVRRLQAHLNDHPLTDGSNLPISGNLLDQTANELRLCREQHGFAASIGDETVREDQLQHIIPFATCGCELIDESPVEPIDPGPEEPEELIQDVGIWDWYSGKKTSEKLVHPDGKWHDIDLPAQPASGHTGKTKEEHFLYLRIHLPSGRSATRTIHTRFVRSNGDETAYKSPAWPADSDNSIAYENYHPEKGSGLGGKWQIQVDGGSDPIDYTTRYAKTYVTYREE